MNNKTVGIRLENKLKKNYEDNGWIVLHTKGSLGFVDLICFKYKNIDLVSIKRALRKKYIKQRFADAEKAIPKELGWTVTIMVYDVEGKEWLTKIRTPNPDE